MQSAARGASFSSARSPKGGAAPRGRAVDLLAVGDEGDVARVHDVERAGQGVALRDDAMVVLLPHLDLAHLARHVAQHPARQRGHQRVAGERLDDEVVVALRLAPHQLGHADHAVAVHVEVGEVGSAFLSALDQAQLLQPVLEVVQSHLAVAVRIDDGLEHGEAHALVEELLLEEARRELRRPHRRVRTPVAAVQHVVDLAEVAFGAVDTELLQPTLKVPGADFAVAIAVDVLLQLLQRDAPVLQLLQERRHARETGGHDRR